MQEVSEGLREIFFTVLSKNLKNFWAYLHNSHYIKNLEFSLYTSDFYMEYTTLYKMEDPVAFSAQKERNQKRREESPTLWLCFLFWATTFLFQQCAKGKAQKIEKDKMLSSRKLFTSQKKGHRSIFKKRP